MQSAWKFHFLISKDQQSLAGASLIFKVQFLRGRQSDCPSGVTVHPIATCVGGRVGRGGTGSLARAPLGGGSIPVDGRWSSEKGAAGWLDSSSSLCTSLKRQKGPKLQGRVWLRRVACDCTCEGVPGRLWLRNGLSSSNVQLSAW